MRTAAASILRAPGIAARYVRTDPQAAAETMAVFTRLTWFNGGLMVV